MTAPCAHPNTRERTCKHCAQPIAKMCCQRDDGQWRHLATGYMHCDPTDPDFTAAPRRLPAIFRKTTG